MSLGFRPRGALISNCVSRIMDMADMDMDMDMCCLETGGKVLGRQGGPIIQSSTDNHL